MYFFSVQHITLNWFKLNNGSRIIRGGLFIMKFKYLSDKKTFIIKEIAD